jgi:hypothetical protein
MARDARIRDDNDPDAMAFVLHDERTMKLPDSEEASIET